VFVARDVSPVRPIQLAIEGWDGLDRVTTHMPEYMNYVHADRDQARQLADQIGVLPMDWRRHQGRTDWMS